MIKKILKLAAVVSLVPAALFAQKQSGWNSLPEDTIAAINVDFSTTITDKLQNNTNLGKKIFNQARLNRLKEVIKNHASVNPQMAAGLAELKACGFDLDDIFGLMNNKMGLGLIPGTAGTQKYFTLLFWADFNDDLINKIYRVVDEKAGKEKKRVDIELDGEKVIYLSGGKDLSHVMITRLGQRFIVSISNFDKNSQFAEFSEGDLKALEDAFEKKSGTGSIKITPFQDEFVEGAEKQPANSTLTAASAALGELLKARTAQFLMAQKGSGGEFASRLLSKPGVANARPAGDMVIEGYIDIAKALELSDAKMDEVALLGLDKLEALALWCSLDGHKAKTSFFISSPAPRKGLLALLDQPLTDALPPAWVPENVMNYSHFSFDFNILYDVIKKIASTQLGPGAVDAQEQKANQAITAFLGVDLKTLINSFGKKVYQVNFGLELQNTASAASGLKALPVDKTAIVLEFNDDAIMKKVLDMLGPFVQGQGFTRTKEQGFDGYRVDLPQFKGSVFYGQKKLVVSIGEGTTELVLSAMSNPPKGADALINSRKFTSFLNQENPEKSILFTYGDAAKMAPMIYQTLSQMFSREDILSNIGSDREKAFVNDLLDLVPAESEIDGVFGSSHSVALPIESGFIFKSSIDLP